MSNNTIDARLLRQMFLAGAKNLELNKEWINDLNVFPVPDGDTGTNMTLTILSAVKEVQNLSEVTMETLSKAISSGSLRGARGNSGVILSQLFRGFTKELKTLELLDRPAAARALQRATETAYKAVMKPKEGTILTVARGISDKAAELAEEEGDMESFLEQLISHGEYVLSCTPDMLPVLKQAGVVDSGGQGLIQVLKGTYDGLLGKEIEAPQAAEQKPTAEEKASAGAASRSAILSSVTAPSLSLIWRRNSLWRRNIPSRLILESIGDSIVVVADDEIVKVHVHTNDPGLAIQKALTYGSLSRMKIDNMREEHEEKLIREASRVAAEEKVKEQAAAEAAKASEPRKEAGFVAVSIGDGLAEIFRGLNVDYIIEGGQTMNPSTEDMLQAVDHVNADTIYIFPNNKNIILAAEQAAHLVIDKQIIVVPSTTVPQGITGVISYSPSRTPEENREVMIEEMKRVKTGQVTYAVRNTTIDDRPIHEGDIMGIGDHSSLLAVGSDIASVTQDMLEAMVNEESELISIYYGADITEEDAEKMQMAVETSYPDCDVEVHYGGQPIYYYIVSVE